MSVSAADLQKSRFWLVTLLLVATVLRVFLVSEGGQFFFGDEGRHERGVALYEAFRSGDLTVVKATLARPEHIGFTLLGAGTTGLQHLSAQFTRWSDWRHPENILFSLPIGAAWLAMFSVVNIWLVHSIARCAGASVSEAGWAALLMTCSNSGFYYARHFLPYDASLTCALAAISLGLGGRRSFLCGLLAGATYHLYNGYWYLVPVILMVHASADAPSIRSRMRRLLVTLGGIACAMFLPLAIGLSLVGRTYWETMLAFSGTVNQGLYHEGWSLPWEYFWHAEGALGVAVCLAIGAAIAISRNSLSIIDRRLWLWLGVASMSYGLLVVFSVGFEKFVVYARSVKPLVPFFCLAGGWSMARLLGRHRKAGLMVAVACGLAAFINFLPHFGFLFPADVERRVLREIGNPKHSLSVSGSIYIPLALPVTRPDLVLVNAQLLYPVRSYLGYPPGDTILSISHPLSYRPFQYESHSPRERTLLRTNDIRICLIRLTDAASLPNDLSFEERFSASDRPDGLR